MVKSPHQSFASRGEGMPHGGAKSAPVVQRSTPVYELTMLLHRIIMPCFFRWQVHGRFHIPSGAVILAANHVSVADPTTISAAIYYRKVDWLAKRSLYDIRGLGTLLRHLDTIPVTHESADLGALREALRRLALGRVVGIFPEGGISRDGQLQEGRQGVSILAHRAQAPVVPVSISGTRPLVRFDGWRPRFSEVHIRFGPPIPPPVGKRLREEDRLAHTRLIMQGIAELQQQDAESRHDRPRTQG